MRIAARPKRAGNPPGPGDGLSGVVGVRDPLTLRRDLSVLTPPPGAGVTREVRRFSVETPVKFVERPSAELPRTDPARMRGSPWLALMESGELAVMAGDARGAASPSCHCRWRITDFVAH